ncbi:MAG: hypothetical protein AAFQ88_14125 [Pseudomonadota bacterium]
MNTLTGRTVLFVLIWSIMVGVHAVFALDDRLDLMLAALGAAAGGIVLALALRRQVSSLVRDLIAALLVPVTAGVALVPLAPMLWQADGAIETLNDVILWPAMVVLLAASRALVSLAALSAASSWHGVDPIAAQGSGGRGQPLAPALQDAASGASTRIGGRSLFGSVFLGGFLTMGLYGGVAAAGLSAENPFAQPLLGDTPVNALVVLLFAIVLAEIGEAWLAVLRDRAVLEGLARRDEPLVPALGGLTGEARATMAARRLSAQVAGGAAGAAVIAADATMERAARRYVRTLIAALPMTGFAGTVIGLTVSLGALPAVLDQVAEAGGLGQALSGALAGLSTAFETTLLGLAGSLVATVLLAGLERAEAATVAAGDLIAAGAGAGDGAPTVAGAGA